MQRNMGANCGLDLAGFADFLLFVVDREIHRLGTADAGEAIYNLEQIESVARGLTDVLGGCPRAVAEKCVALLDRTAARLDTQS